MFTIRQIASCAGLGAPISVRALAPPPPTSVLGAAYAHMRPTIDLAFIMVGTRAAADLLGGPFLEALRAKLAQFDIGVGSVLTLALLDPASKAYADIDSNDEADALVDEWELSGHHADIFFVKSYAGPTLGIATYVCASCELGGLPKGIVVEVAQSLESLVLCVAHEIGHHLCLERDEVDPAHKHHHPSPDNLMYFQVPNGGALLPHQIARMRKHCLVYWACRPRDER
jgi:hypothetical protein